ncbi:MAG: thioesterase [Desulfobacterales bacterium]|jgi:acyl-ACP thioesterase
MQPNVWKDTFRIRSYEVDCHGKLSMLSIFNFMQEAASSHADALGVSIQQLLCENYTWLLSRVKITMTSYPAWTDDLTVMTWPSGMQRLFALRDFQFKDQKDSIVGAALSAWLVIDTHKRRPVRIAPFIKRLKPVEGDHILPGPLDKLQPLDTHDSERKFQVRFRDLDINQHVNNTSYVEWILESMPAAVKKDAILTELEINFLAESFLHDRIIANCLSLSTNNREFRHGLYREEDGQELVRATTVWKPA